MRAATAAALLTAFAIFGGLGRDAATAAAEPASCWSETPQPGLGSVDPFRPPVAAAAEANAAGKTAYRQGKWEEARAHYRAALAADPDFLAPRLNIACSFVRQDRFADAIAEARALIERAYVPWAREVLEAADLGALKPRPEMQELRRVMAGAAASWAEGLDRAIVFVGRLRAPLRVPPEGQGVFLLNPQQEVFAFFPELRRYRQLTAEDGHVVAMARSPDGRRLSFVTAEKLVRGPGRGEVALRGVAISELALSSMAPSPIARVAGDVRALRIENAAGRFAYRLDQNGGSRRYRLGGSDSAPLFPMPGPERPGEALARLTPRGAETAGRTEIVPGCSTSARDRPGPGAANRVVEVRVAGRARLQIGATFGAGLNGLPLP